VADGSGPPLRSPPLRTSCPPGDIRQYQSADVPHLEKFKCRQPRENWGRRAQKLIHEAPTKIGRGLDADIFVAVDGDRVVGALVIGAGSLHIPPNRVEDCFTVYALGVVPDRQNQGVGGLLKRAVMAEIAAGGPGRVIVSEVFRRNARMIAVNKRLGVSTFPHPDDNKYLLTVVRVEFEV
jgi:GNAT superfamily N-acetyltransferase